LPTVPAYDEEAPSPADEIRRALAGFGDEDDDAVEPLGPGDTGAAGSEEEPAESSDIQPPGLDREAWESDRSQPDDTDPDDEAEAPRISPGETDYYFAAGLNGPPGEGQAPSPGFSPFFGHRPSRPAGATEGAGAPPPSGETEETTEEIPSPPQEASLPDSSRHPGGSLSRRRPDGDDEPAAGSDLRPEEGDEEVFPVGDPAEVATQIIPSPAEEPDPADAETESEPARESEDAPGGTKESRRGRLSQLLRKTAGSAPAAEEASFGRENEDGATDDLPTPISDSENVRQWLLVGAGGLVLLAILGVVAWGLMSLLGGEPPAAASPSQPVATSAPALEPTAPPPTSPPATVSSPTTVPPENAAAAAGFVSEWNGLASEYAYHLTISADSLPISTAPAPTVHLTYGPDDVLLLTMAPKGTGADRDILVAMGLAVAWADPDLSPEARKQLLGSMGIDVDDPQVADMGGSVERNGVAYSTSVTDGVIRFQVERSA
ncbi:MAG: hypothetical protein ACLFWM_13735, partial [Actinomycetota bacterium]